MGAASSIAAPWSPQEATITEPGAAQSPRDPWLQQLAEQMVHQQIVPRGVTDARVLQTLRTVPRHRFAAAREPASCYDDAPIAIGHGQTMSQPYMVAVMSELLNLSGRERVLEVGSGSGYQSAVLAELAREVCAIERIPQLFMRAAALLAELGYANVKCRQGDGVLGWRDAAPFDRILVAAAAAEVPPQLPQQLADNGILVMPVGGEQVQHLMVVRRVGSRLQVDAEGACRFVPLIRDGNDQAVGPNGGGNERG